MDANPDYTIATPDAVEAVPVRPVTLTLSVTVTSRIDSNNGATNEQIESGLNADLRKFFEWQFPVGVDGVVSAHIETDVKVEDA